VTETIESMPTQFDQQQLAQDLVERPAPMLWSWSARVGC
jgi:hypothetical protein